MTLQKDLHEAQAQLDPVKLAQAATKVLSSHTGDIQANAALDNAEIEALRNEVITGLYCARRV